MDWSKRFKEKMKEVQENIICASTICPEGLIFGEDIDMSACNVNCSLYKMCDLKYEELCK